MRSLFPSWARCCASGRNPQAPRTVSQREPSVLGAAALCRLLPAELPAAITGMVRYARAPSRSSHQAIPNRVSNTRGLEMRSEKRYTA